MAESTNQWLRSRVKRSLDVVLASCGLIAASPLIAFLSIAIVATMGRPILFRQERPGVAGRPFTMLKFRSMTAAGPDAAESEPDDDLESTRRRVTRVGYWMRKTSLDELPELWNVLRGEMSLVGPRPLLTEYLPYYSPEQMRRHDLRPGVTGLAQVRGRHSLDWDARFKLDTWYVDHQSLRLDARIMFDTLAVLIRPSGQVDFDEGSEPPRFDVIAAREAAVSPETERDIGGPVDVS